MFYPVKQANPIVAAIAALYGLASDTNRAIDELIEAMKRSPNQTASRTGRILEGAKYGFGIGFITPIAIIALGQLILGNPLAAAATVMTSPVNPIAMTCAAIGAIYYGWAALSEDERNTIVNKLRDGLEIGVELIKAIVKYVLATAKELLSAENLAEVKRFIGDAAAYFGKTLTDVTHSIKDHAAGAYDFVADKIKRAPAQPKELPRLPLSPQKKKPAP